MSLRSVGQDGARVALFSSDLRTESKGRSRGLSSMTISTSNAWIRELLCLMAQPTENSGIYAEEQG